MIFFNSFFLFSSRSIFLYIYVFNFLIEIEIKREYSSCWYSFVDYLFTLGWCENGSVRQFLLSGVVYWSGSPKLAGRPGLRPWHGDPDHPSITNLVSYQGRIICHYHCTEQLPHDVTAVRLLWLVIFQVQIGVTDNERVRVAHKLCNYYHARKM